MEKQLYMGIGGVTVKEERTDRQKKRESECTMVKNRKNTVKIAIQSFIVP